MASRVCRRDAHDFQSPPHRGTDCNAALPRSAAARARAFSPSSSGNKLIHQAMVVLYTISPYTRVEEIIPMGRTNIVLDDRLVREALRRFGCRSKRELVHLALVELLKSARRRDL